MKKIITGFCAVAAMALGSCSQEEELFLVNDTKEAFVGVIDVTDSRTTLGDEGKVVWSEGDEISIFKKSGYHQKYKVAKGGSIEAAFDYAGESNKHNLALNQNYAVYPYSANHQLTENGIFTLDLSSLATQNYTENSFEDEKSVMTAKSSDTNLFFYNALSMIRFKLWSEVPAAYNIQSITLSSATKALYGTATIDMSEEKPVAEFSGDGKTITLTCGNAVVLENEGSDEDGTATGGHDFYMMVPAGTYNANDLTIKIEGTDENGKTLVYEAEYSDPLELKRSEFFTIYKGFKAETWTGTIENDWDGTSITPVQEEDGIYKINTPAELAWVAEQVNSKQNNFAGKTVQLMTNINLSGYPWTPISTGCGVKGDNLGECFSGIFDGGDHTISNMTVNGQNYVGLFASAVGTIKNVKLQNVSVEGTKYVGAVVGYMYGTVENCHVDGGSITATVFDKDNNGSNVGGVVGYLGEMDGVVSGNKVSNVTITAYCKVGGGVGTALSGATVTNNVLTNVKVIADMLQDGGETDANADKVVGRNIANADLSSNTTNNVTVEIWKPEPGVTYVRANNIPKNFSEDGIYQFVGNFPNEVTINCAQGKAQLFDASQATFNNHIKIQVNRIADNMQDINAERSGEYTFRSFTTPNSIAFGACAVESLKIEGCESYMMYLNITNSKVTATGNKIIRPASAEDSYKRFDGEMQKDIVQVYADNYTLELDNNDIKDEKGVGNNIEIYGNYEQFQKYVDENNKWINSISATGNNIANVSDTTPLVKIYNDLTFAPVAWPEDYVTPDATKKLAEQLKTGNTLTGGSCTVDILCRAKDKLDTNIQL